VRKAPAAELPELSTSAAAELSAQPAERTAIVVLGMHRSGTSVVTRALSLLGAALPKTLMPPKEGNNEAGFWEPLRLVLLHEHMLLEAGSYWDDWRAFDPAALGSERLSSYRQEIRDLIAEEYAEEPVLLIKDPRICRFPRLYEEVLAELRIACRYVLVHRNPLAVIASLARRDGMTRGFAGLLWLRYVLDSEAATRGRPRSIVSYEAFLDDWRAPTERIAPALELEWPRSIEEATAEIDDYILRDLQHHAPKLAELERDPDIAGWIKRAYPALLRLSEHGEDADALATLDAVRAEFEAAAPLFGDATYPELWRIRSESWEKDKKLETLRRWLGRTWRRAGAVVHAARQLKEQIAADEKRIGSLERELESLRNSLTWRYGAMVRKLFSFANAAVLYAGCKVSLRPRSEVESVAAERRATEWAMTGDDPQFNLVPRGRLSLPPGRYRLSMDVPEGSDELVLPHLYFNCGRGYNEYDVVPLNFRPRANNRFVSTFLLPEWGDRLRFDPSNRPGRISIGRVRLRRITAAEYYTGVLKRLTRRYVTDRHALARIVRRGVRIFRVNGFRGLFDAVRAVEAKGAPGRAGYRTWVALYDTLTKADLEEMRRQSKQISYRPLISVVMPTYNTPAELLQEAIESVLAQTYDNWELCVADDCSTEPHVRAILEECRQRDSRIKVVYRERNGHISHASNSALELATGEWVALLDHDDALRPHALFCVADAINRHPDARLIYSDEDKIDLAGRRHDPYFKCDWNPDLFLSHNLITHLGVYRADLLAEVGGFRPGFEGAQDYDLALRCVERLEPEQIHHIPHVLYHWRVVPGSTAIAPEEKPYAMLAGERALSEHFARLKMDATPHLIRHAYRIDYALPEEPPLVSIIIPTRNAKDLVEQCVASIKRRTHYPNYEILLVDNNSDDPASLASFKRLEEQGDVRIIRDERPFNFSALNNNAVKHAQGSVVALVNNDIEVISLDWLSRMVALALRPGTGAVGAKLLFPNDTLQHGGIVMGLGGLAAHAHSLLPRTAPGYAGRAGLAQNFAAVTAACLVVRRDHYEAVGGLNETDLTVAYNDVDFCLKLTRQLGLRNVWTPFAELYHYESATRGYETTPEKQTRFNAEKAWMLRTWKEVIDYDPAYSPNLTLDRADFGLAFPPRAEKPWMSRPKEAGPAGPRER
jgi:glycosyltransferase involved in cell wall biosynthesis